MIIYKKYIFAVLSFVLAIALSAGYAYGAQNRPARRRVRARDIKREQLQDIREDKARARQYKKIHDLNNDGVVDLRDRLIWLRKKDGNYDKVYISTENEDLAEVMDSDGDGNVESWEMRAFFENYDLNNDGALDDYEIGQAIGGE